MHRTYSLIGFVFLIFALFSTLCCSDLSDIFSNPSDTSNDTSIVRFTCNVHDGSTIQSGGTESFYEVNIGSYKDLTFDITNTGNVSIKIVEVSASASGFSVTYAFQGNIDPNVTKNFGIRFTPPSSGEYSCPVVIQIEGQPDFFFTLTGTGKSAYAIAPPAWIQGNWRNESNGIWLNWEFQSANALHTSSSAGLIIDVAADNGIWAAQGIDEGYYDYNFSDTNYSIMLKSNGSVQETYSFDQTSATTLNYTLNTTTIVLTKQ